ncbi:unnamed protein product [Prunus brigantina]
MISCISCSVAKVVAMECVPHLSLGLLLIMVFSFNFFWLGGWYSLLFALLLELCGLHHLFNKGYIMVISGFLVTFHTINDSLSLLCA